MTPDADDEKLAQALELLTKWLAALFLMTASMKGIGADRVHRMLGISYKSTWLLMHRLREVMRVGGRLPPKGQGGGAA